MGVTAVLGVAHGGPTLTTACNLSSGCPLKLYAWTHLESQQEIKNSLSTAVSVTFCSWPFRVTLECGWGHWDSNRALVSLTVSMLPLVHLVAL